MAGAITVLLLQSPLLDKRVINPLGWNIPDQKMLRLEEVERKNYPGISSSIIVELYGYEGRFKSTAGYYITNPVFYEDKSIKPNQLMKQKVEGLDIYKTSDGRVLCYCYSFLDAGLTRESQAGMAKSFTISGGMIAFIADLDNDGLNESWFPLSGYTKKDEQLLVSIMRAKLGLMGENR
jgi:hypothetical protein